MPLAPTAAGATMRVIAGPPSRFASAGVSGLGA